MNSFVCQDLSSNPTACCFSGQMFLMNKFFNGAFFTFGLEVIAFSQRDQEDRIDPMIYIFPRMTKCTFNKFGASGEVEKHDTLCILPLNIINEKIYIFLWFWFLILGGVTAIMIFYRFLIVVSSSLQTYLLCGQFGIIKPEVIQTIMKKKGYGDWYLLFMLSQNVDELQYQSVLEEVAKRLGYTDKNDKKDGEGYEPSWGNTNSQKV